MYYKNAQLPLHLTLMKKFQIHRQQKRLLKKLTGADSIRKPIWWAFHFAIGCQKSVFLFTGNVRTSYLCKRNGFHDFLMGFGAGWIRAVNQIINILNYLVGGLVVYPHLPEWFLRNDEFFIISTESSKSHVVDDLSTLNRTEAISLLERVRCSPSLRLKIHTLNIR